MPSKHSMINTHDSVNEYAAPELSQNANFTMKKFLAIAVAAIATVFSASADNWYAGGNIGFWHESGEGKELSTNEFFIQPEVGYNINSQWAVGLGIGYDLKGFCNAKTTDHFFNFDPYARFSYFRTSNNLVQLFVDGTVGFGAGVRNHDGDSSDTALKWHVGFRPGVAFNVTDRFSIVAHLGFLGYNGANDEAKAMGYRNEGGLKFTTNDLKLGFYFNF